jgi:predicted metal-dependent phosphotriesterase family hydrolase
MGKGALEQLDVLESVGVHPARVAIGHLGGIADPDARVQKTICKRGAFVGFDRQGGPQHATGNSRGQSTPISGVHPTQPPVKRK